MEASRRSSGMALRIIEHVWAHRTMDIQVVEASSWLDVDSLLPSLEDSGKLRVASALVYSIMRRRDVARFDAVMSFLEATRRLFPGLVTAIKHMKILFGLKTLVIMWMLREEERLSDIVYKIIQFFPNRLPQYQHQSSHREMFLMRRNHQDFKDFALGLSMDKKRRQNYIQTQMQEQYGERYAQKVEERLLHYLHQLEAAQPADTYVDRIMKKDSPVTEEEKLLLDVITSDCSAITTTLKNLLHCDAVSCHLAVGSQDDTQPPRLSTSELDKKPCNAASVSFRDVACPSLSENDSTVGHQQSPSERDSSSQRLPVPSPQFCSRHQRWVTSILQGCQDDGPEPNVSCSPLLFSGSSASSSQDLTLSDLVPSHGALPPHTDEQQIPEIEKNDKRSEKLFSAVVRLVDISTHPSYEAFQTPPTPFTVCKNNKRLTVPPANQDRRREMAACTDAALTRRHTQILRTRSSVGRSRRKRPLGDILSSCSSSTQDSVTQQARSSPANEQNQYPLKPPHPPPPLAFPPQTGRVLRARLGSWIPTQAALLQPYVSLSRLSAEECIRAMAFCAHRQPEEEEVDSSFDLNDLYSGSEGDDSLLHEHDPDYKPWIKKKRL